MLKGTIKPVAILEAHIDGVKTLKPELNPRVDILAKLNSKPNITARLNEPAAISATINSTGSMVGKLGLVADREEYDGEYIVTPSRVATDLKTKHKVMRGDIHVKEIPYYETSNETGTTIYIGGNDG